MEVNDLDAHQLPSQDEATQNKYLLDASMDTLEMAIKSQGIYYQNEDTQDEKEQEEETYILVCSCSCSCSCSCFIAFNFINHCFLSSASVFFFS